MNAPTYPDADHSAPSRPMHRQRPGEPARAGELLDRPDEDLRPWPGTTWLTLSITVWVAPGPSRPSIAVSTTMPGKIDSTP